MSSSWVLAIAPVVAVPAITPVSVASRLFGDVFEFASCNQHSKFLLLQLFRR
jgi:hypothetical protein